MEIEKITSAAGALLGIQPVLGGWALPPVI